MRYDVWLIESLQHQAVDSKYLGARAVPFSLVTLVGQATIPTQDEIRLIGEVIFALAKEHGSLCFLRTGAQGDPNEQAFLEACSVWYRPIQVRFPGTWLRRPSAERAFAVSEDACELFCETLMAHWKTYGGNWVFWAQPVRGELPGHVAAATRPSSFYPSRIRDALFEVFPLAAITLDDGFLDCYVESAPAHVAGIIERAARDSGVAIDRE